MSGEELRFVKLTEWELQGSWRFLQLVGVGVAVSTLLVFFCGSDLWAVILGVPSYILLIVIGIRTGMAKKNLSASTLELPSGALSAGQTYTCTLEFIPSYSLKVFRWRPTLIGERTWEGELELEGEDLCRVEKFILVGDRLARGRPSRWSVSLSIPQNALPTSTSEREEVFWLVHMSVDFTLGLSLRLKDPVELAVLGPV